MYERFQPQLMRGVLPYFAYLLDRQLARENNRVRAERIQRVCRGAVRDAKTPSAGRFREGVLNLTENFGYGLKLIARTSTGAFQPP